MNKYFKLNKQKTRENKVFPAVTYSKYIFAYPRNKSPACSKDKMFAFSENQSSG